MWIPALMLAHSTLLFSLLCYQHRIESLQLFNATLWVNQVTICFVEREREGRVGTKVASRRSHGGINRRRGRVVVNMIAMQRAMSVGCRVRCVSGLSGDISRITRLSMLCKGSPPAARVTVGVTVTVTPTPTPSPATASVASCSASSSSSTTTTTMMVPVAIPSRHVCGTIGRRYGHREREREKERKKTSVWKHNSLLFQNS